ncbi:hypothetical protein JAAARDRAFT_197364 [Jaapia argillacea MUCL 33604]|uniref:Uncharacterized protein n=1 Tax=Jaapia argillacea MUCL 33604 TaxID=933084 RepID=A0A067PF74_9AGAM|nr:hypothetical protein JAAARDRAFT_197364 [Jaapia argillacea MUCL 33604]
MNDTDVNEEPDLVSPLQGITLSTPSASEDDARAEAEDDALLDVLSRGCEAETIPIPSQNTGGPPPPPRTYPHAPPGLLDPGSRSYSASSSVARDVDPRLVPNEQGVYVVPMDQLADTIDRLEKQETEKELSEVMEGERGSGSGLGDRSHSAHIDGVSPALAKMLRELRRQHQQHHSQSHLPRAPSSISSHSQDHPGLRRISSDPHSDAHPPPPRGGLGPIPLADLLNRLHQRQRRSVEDEVVEDESADDRAVTNGTPPLPRRMSLPHDFYSQRAGGRGSRAGGRGTGRAFSPNALHFVYPPIANQAPTRGPQSSDELMPPAGVDSDESQSSAPPAEKLAEFLHRLENRQLHLTPSNHHSQPQPQEPSRFPLPYSFGRSPSSLTPPSPRPHPHHEFSTGYEAGFRDGFQEGLEIGRRQGMKFSSMGVGVVGARGSDEGGSEYDPLGGAVPVPFDPRYVRDGLTPPSGDHEVGTAAGPAGYRFIG